MWNLKQKNTNDMGFFTKQKELCMQKTNMVTGGRREEAEMDV